MLMHAIRSSLCLSVGWLLIIGCRREEPAAVQIEPAVNAKVPAVPTPSPAPNVVVPAKTPLRVPVDGPLAAKHEHVSSEQIAVLRAAISSASSYPKRLEARRGLMHALRRSGQYELLLGEVVNLIDEVERREGPTVAARVTMAEAETFQAQKDPKAAIEAYSYLRDRYPENDFSVEALYQIGLCHLDARDYDRAEQSFQQLVERYDNSVFSPWAWRKLALAQLLQNRVGSALATLQVMADKYKGSEFAEYAQAREGYVQLVAGNRDRARDSFQAFLARCPQSKYCELVKSQLALAITDPNSRALRSDK